MTSNNDSGIFGEIANMGAVVVNTQHDISDISRRMNAKESDIYRYSGAPPSTDNATVRVDINDLVFTVNGGSGGRRALNNAIPVTSNCNGLYVHKNKIKMAIRDRNDEDEVNQALSESIRLIGQAIGASNPLPEREEHLKLNFTTRVHGTGHIINTGDSNLHPGETVYWTLFNKRDTMKEDGSISNEWKKKFARYGFSPRKVPLKLVGISNVHEPFDNSIYKELKERVKPDGGNRSGTAPGKFGNGVLDFISDMAYIQGGGDDVEAMKTGRGENGVFDNMAGKEPLVKAAVNDLIKSIMYLVADIDRRKVGRALSYAKPGKGVDILLGV